MTLPSDWWPINWFLREVQNPSGAYEIAIIDRETNRDLGGGVSRRSRAHAREMAFSHARWLREHPEAIRL